MFSLLRRESLWIPVILLVVMIGCWVELDLYAPSFPQMMHFFGTTEQMMQWTLSLNFLGFFLASLVCGPLADSFGRRKIILGGSFIFVLGSLICLLSGSIEWMLFGRLVQGIGVSAPVTVCMAVIADIYQGERQMKLLTRMNSAITITMALAPIVGVYLTDTLSWHANFIVIFVISIIGLILVARFVPETHDKHLRTEFKPSTLVSGYITLLKSKAFMSAVLGCCFAVTPYFILIGILPLLFMESLGVSINSYAFYQGSIVGLFSLVSISVPWILARFTLKNVIRVSMTLAIGGLSVALVLSMLMPDMPELITALMCIYAVGIVVPPTMLFSNAMDMFPELRASASSLIQSIRMLSMSLGTALAGFIYNGTFMPVIFVMTTLLILSVPMTIASLRRREIAGDSMPSDIVPAMH